MRTYDAINDTPTGQSRCRSCFLCCGKSPIEPSTLLITEYEKGITRMPRLSDFRRHRLRI